MEESPPETEEFTWTARADGVADVAVDQAGIFEDGGRRRSFGMYGEVGEETAFGVGKGSGDQMECRKCNQRIAEAAQPVDKDPFCRASMDSL